MTTGPHRILAMTPGDFRTADSGGRSREYHLCSALARIGRLDVLTYRPHQATPGVRRPIDADVVLDDKPPRALTLARSLASGHAYHADLFDPRRHRRFPQMARTRYAVIHCSFWYSIPAALELVAGASAGAVVVWDTHNYDAEVWAEMANRGGGLRSRFAARQLQPTLEGMAIAAGAADVIVACTDRDAESLKALAPNRRVEVVPNGGHTIQWSEVAESVVPELGSLVIFGGLSQDSTAHGIEWFLDAVWPAVSRSTPRPTLTIAGRGPSPSLARRIRNRDGVRLVANPSDLAAVVAAAETIVVPQVWGTGSKIKMFEALATGRRVVVSPAALVGLPDDLIGQIEVADGREKWIETLAAKPPMAVTAETRRDAAARYEWSAISQRYEQTVRNALERYVGHEHLAEG